MNEEVTGHNYFTNPVIGTKYLSKEEVLSLRKKALISFYLRPVYIIKTLSTIKSFKSLLNYIKYGLRLLKNIS